MASGFRVMIADVAPGETRRLPVPDDMDARVFRQRLGSAAIALWGAGSYSAPPPGPDGAVAFTRCPEDAALMRARADDLEPHPPQPRRDDVEWLTREAAAMRIAPLFGGRMTAEHLRRLAVARRGPPYYRRGGRVLYRADELLAWARASLVRVDPAADRAA
jgi:hypothetical protein